MEFIFFLLAFFLLFAALRPVTTFLHELGHALPALFFTSGPVSMVIGVPDTLPQEPLFRVARLKVWITKNPLLWLGGYCVHDAPRWRWQYVIIGLGGVLFSLIVASTVAYWSFVIDAHGFIRALLVLIALSTGLDIFIDWIPRASPVHLSDGKISVNDGQVLRLLFTRRRLLAQWDTALEHLQNGENDKAWSLYRNLLDQGWNEVGAYHNGMLALYNLNRYPEALALYEEWRSNSHVITSGHSLAGWIRIVEGDLRTALVIYERAYEQDPTDADVLNNLGYLLNRLDRFVEAVPYFDRALALKPDFAYSLNNRGLSRLKLGDRSGGLADIERGLELDPENSYGYRNLGIHHLDEGRPAEALELFVKARSMDPKTDMIDQLIREAQRAAGTSAE